MAKRVAVWALPSLAFVVAAMAMLLSGPSWALLSRRTFFQSSTDNTCGCKDCCDPDDGSDTGSDSDGDSDGEGDGNSNGNETANNNTYCFLSAYPVNYYTGENIWGTTDLRDGGFDHMKASRAFVTMPQYSDNTFGPCWRWSVPQLIDMGNHVNLVMGSRHAKSWTKVKDGSGNVTGYTPDFFYKDTLTITDVNTLIFHDENGDTMIFYNFTYPTPAFRGKLYQAFNASLIVPNSAGVSGSFIQANYTSGGIFGGVIQEEETSGVVDTANNNQFVANLGGPFSTLVTTSIFQFHTVANTSSTVRSTSNEYYDGSDSANGPAGCLKRVTIMDPASNAIERKYYRYGNSGGKVTLRTVVEGAAYERLRHAVGDSDANVLTASDATVNQYANTFAYDVNGRVTSEAIQGKGTYSFTLAVSNSGFTAGTNSWQRKTVETLPDGNTNTVYTSFSGQAILKVFTQGAQQWCQGYQFDANARLILEAMPSAIASFSESSPGLFTLNTTGLVKLTNFATTTTATTTTAGDVAGYVKSRQVRQGSSGTPITTDSYTYIAHTATASTSVTKYALASKTVYANTDGTGARTTNFAYTWLIPPGTSTQSNQIESVTTTYPAVSTAENGSGIRTSKIQFRDKWRHPTWFKDEDGYIRMNSWDRLTGASTQSIVDVNTSVVGGAPSGWVTPTGGGLNLTTAYVNDFLGRHTKTTDPAGNVTYTVYKDASWETRVYPGWTGTTTTGPTQVSRQDKPGSYQELLTMTAAPHVTGGAPDGTEAISGVVADSRTYRDSGDRPFQEDTYFNAPAWTASTSYGTLGTNFYRRTYGYDAKGRLIHEVDWTGTIRDTTYDGRDRVTATKVGTNDTTSPNMIQDRGFQYDGGGVGDGNLTKSSAFTSASTSLDTTYQYDFRNRRTRTTRPDAVISVLTLDNLGEATLDQTYSNSVSAANLRAQKSIQFDEKGQAYRTTTVNVDPGTGNLGDTLTTDRWFNGRSLQVKSRGANGEFLKTLFDGARRPVSKFICFDDSEANTDYNSALTVNSGTGIAADTVVEQTTQTYDADGNRIQTTTYRRTTSTSKLGDLSATWSANDSRRMFVARWFDAANRPIAVADYGTNGGTTLSRPSSPPPPNSTSYLLATTGYDSGGRPYQTRDNLNRLTQRSFDGLGRATSVVENYVTGSPTETSLDTDRKTGFTFDSSGRLSQRVAYNPKGTGLGVQQQITTYVYRTDSNAATPAVFRNDLLVAEIYPDSDDTYNDAGAAGARLGNGTDGVYDRVEYTYDYASRKSTVKDQRGVVRTTTYDSSGRYSAESVTTLPSGVDGTVLRKGMAYDSLSRKQVVTEYTDAAGSTVQSQVKYTYDGWGNAIKREDSHVGAVVSGTTPSAQLAYADGVTTPPGPAKYVRPASTTYPNGRVVYFNYPAAGSTSVGDHLSRIDNIANDAAGTSQFAQYTYMGAGTILDVNHPLVTNGLVYRQGPDTNPGAWDQFDRQLFTKWRNSANTTSYDLWNYTYDVVSNRLTRQNAATTLPATRNDEFYVYDGLKRLTKMNRGQLTGTPLTITDAASNYEQQWTALETLGNWRGFQVAPTGAGSFTFQQTRSHNSANEIDVDNNDANAPGVSISNSWIAPTADKAGNTTTVPVPGSETTGYFLTYDAWNRLVKVQNGTRAAPGTEVVEYQYDAEGRRTVKLVPNGANWNRTDYFFDLKWRCVEERTLTNVVGKTTVATAPHYQWVWDLKYVDAVLLRDVVPIDTTKRLYYCQDANQNTTALMTESGTVAERYVYDPYGKPTVLTATWTTQSPTVNNNEILFTGLRKDPETQIYLARNRTYHATLGRWLQRDPLVYVDGSSLVEALGSSPIGNRDPLGLCRKECKADVTLTAKNWRVGSGGAFELILKIEIKYQQDKECCKYVQYVNGKVTTGGDGQSGGTPVDRGNDTPLDGNDHVDSLDWKNKGGDTGYNKDGYPIGGHYDQLKKSTNDGDNPATGTDQPGWEGGAGGKRLNEGDQVDWDVTFWGVIYDSCNGYKKVSESKKVETHAHGKYPDKLKTTPDIEK